MAKLVKALTPLLLSLLIACSEPPKPAVEKKKEPLKPAEPVTGRQALQYMYSAARAWTPDAQILRLNSIALSQVKPEPGKSGAWQATFVSASRRLSRSWTYSVVEAEGNLHKGVFAGLEEGYPSSGQAKPFQFLAVKFDSDEAYKTALKKSADYVKKNPDKPISMLLELTGRFPDPAWRVIWGESVGRSNYSIFVDATTGEYLQTMR